MQKAHYAAPGDEPEPHTQEARCWRRTIHPYRVSSSTSPTSSSQEKAGPRRSAATQKMNADAEQHGPLRRTQVP